MNLCKRIRKERRLTQKELAAALNKTVRTIGRWERTANLKPRIITILTDFDMEGHV